MPARLIVDTDDQLTHGHSVRKRNRPPVALELAVGHKTDDEPLMNVPNVANRVPNEFPASIDFDFFVDSGHVSSRGFDTKQNELSLSEMDERYDHQTVL
jgi:hypothetical protein